MSPSRALRDVMVASVVYALGDAIAAMILGDWTWHRSVGLMLLCGTVYGVEVPAWFRLIDRRCPVGTRGAARRRTLFAVLYFNPLWIARHLLFIQLAALQFDAIQWSLLEDGLRAFLLSAPATLIANLVIQTRIPLDWRLFASAVFSGLMAIYYALSTSLW